MDTYNEKISNLIDSADSRYKIESDFYNNFRVKRGLRNSDGTGVLAGLTAIGEVRGYIIDDGEKTPINGKLLYRGIDTKDIISNMRAEGRHGFEEVVFLLLFGFLPDAETLREFKDLLGSLRELPSNFTEDTILKAPSPNIMNKLARCVLSSYTFDDNADDCSLPNMIRQSLELIARMVTMTAYAYQAKRHYYDRESLFIHAPRADYSTAENFFHLTRPDSSFTPLEAEILDVLLVLQAEHGGGNNSAFICRAVSSSGTDTYSAIAAAIGSLKGPKHGGANAKVMSMMENIKQNVSNWADEKEVAEYLRKIVNKEANDNSGLVYGMGHAVYTLSDPRATILRKYAQELAAEKGYMEEFNLYSSVEKLTPKVFAEVKNSNKPICANVDLYSGFVYKMLNIPTELYTPLFAVARIVGWCAHRIEEVIGNGRIIRPAYKSVCPREKYVKLADR